MSDLLKIEESRPTPIDPAKFEEASADAKRAHIDRERPDIIYDFSNNPDSLPQKNPNSEILQKSPPSKSPAKTVSNMFSQHISPSVLNTNSTKTSSKNIPQSRFTKESHKILSGPDF